MKKVLTFLSAIAISLSSYAKEYLIESVHIPEQLITKAANDCDSVKITEPVLFMEVYSTDTGEILLRSDGQSFGGNKTDFDFGKYGNIIDIKDADFPLSIRVLVGPKKGVERTARGLAGGGTGALIGGIVGGGLGAFFTLGFGAPVGAGVGALIGGAIGGTAAAIVPITDAKEVIFFKFNSETGFASTHKNTITGNDILSDGQEATITIKEK